MSLRCKVGDLALVVRTISADEWVGRIVKVVAPYPYDAGWFTEPAPMGSIGFYDAHLRPIRDNDGEDETLTWAGKPSDIKTPEAA